jgi:hypothetical protein
MLVCEFLHCTKSELEKRLHEGNGFADYFLILAYLEAKAEKEAEVAERAKDRATMGQGQ